MPDTSFFFSYTRDMIESHPLYLREIGAHLPWWKRGVIPLYLSVMALLALIVLMTIVEYYIQIRQISSFGVAIVGWFTYMLAWEIRASSRLEKLRKSGALMELNLSRNTPTLNLCAFIHAHARQRSLWFIPFVILMFVVIKDFLFGPTAKTTPYWIVVGVFILGFGTALAVALIAVRRRGGPGAGIVSIGSQQVIDAIWKQNPIHEYTQYFVILVLSFISVLEIVSFSNVFMMLIPLYFHLVSRMQKRYRALTADQWDDFLTRFCQGENPNPKEYTST